MVTLFTVTLFWSSIQGHSEGADTGPKRFVEKMKKVGKEVGSESKKAGKAIGKDTVKAGKKVGKTTKKVAKEVGKGFAGAFKELKEAVTEEKKVEKK